VKRKPSGAPTTARGCAKEGRGDDRAVKPKPSKKGRKNLTPPEDAAAEDDRKLAAMLFDYSTPPPWPGAPARQRIEVSETVPLADLPVLLRQCLQKLESPKPWEEHRALHRSVHFLGLCIVDWLLTTGVHAANEVQASAQWHLAGLAEHACRAYTSALDLRLSKVCAHARRQPMVPGFVSRNPATAEGWKQLLDAVGQGDECAVPMPTGKKHRNTALPKHQLVSCLHDYMEGNFRARARGNAVAGMDVSRYAPPRVREIIALEPLDAKTCQDWHRVARDIVLDWTDGNPATHPAFQRPPLNHLLRTDRQKKPALWKDLSSAWRALAASMPARA